MKLYSKGNNYELYHGNMLDMLEVIKPNSIDSIVTDPPYGLTSITKRFGKNDSAPAKQGKDGRFARLSKGFMGKEWDGSGIEYNIDTWKKCYDVLKTGGYLLAFGGPRTYHKIASAIEEAGFEIRDCIMWIYGSGFPKSMNISKGIEAREKYGKSNTVAKRLIEQNCDGETYKVKQTNNGAMGELIETTRKYYIPTSDLAKKWNGWGTCLKPAYEPIIVARKPFNGTLIDNIIKYNVGGINIDECKIGSEERKQLSGRSQAKSLTYSTYSQKNAHYVLAKGRFPSNVILTYNDDDFYEVCGNMPYTKSTPKTPTIGSSFGRLTNFHRESEPSIYDENGSASRYFYCAKASKKDRDEGLDCLNDKVKVFNGKSVNSSKNMKDVEQRFTTICKNTHPTVKPTNLMQYLVRLVTPKCGTILDPFLGSGSTGKAVMYENLERESNYKFIGIELLEEYLNIADLRIKYVCNINKNDNKLT